MSEAPDEVRTLDELRRVGEELRQVFAQERKAIAALDRPTLELIGAMKQTVVARLAELAPRAPKSPDVRTLMHAVRIEAQATALLAATAAQSVRVLLGYEPTGAYDKHARHTSVYDTHRMRVLAVP